MAPKTAEKKVAGKAIAQKKGGKKGGKKRSVESWKIYIYKVRICCSLLLHPCALPCPDACSVVHMLILLHTCMRMSTAGGTK
jgi:hypothetical protein